MSNEIPSLHIQGNPALLHRAQLCLLVWFRAIWNDIILGWGLISCRRSNIILVVCYYTSNWCNALIPEVWFYANGINLNHLVAWFYPVWCFLPPSQGGGQTIACLSGKGHGKKYLPWQTFLADPGKSQGLLHKQRCEFFLSSYCNL